MSLTISECSVCGDYSLEDDPPMVMCAVCYFSFHQHCAIALESIDESLNEEGIEKKHCPKCQGEFIEPEDKAFIEGYTEALSIAKVKKLTLDLVEPLQNFRFKYIKNHLLNLQSITSASDEAIEALAKSKFNLNIGFKDDRLNPQLLRATKETIIELLSYPSRQEDEELDLSSFSVVEDEAIEELMDLNNRSLSFWMSAGDDLEYFAEELEFDVKVSEGVVILHIRAEENEQITGLKAGDVIISCNGLPVTSEEDVNSQIKNNETLNLLINRAGEEMSMSIDLNKLKYPDLMLNGLVEITIEQVKKLISYKGLLSLDGLIKIDDEKAELFSKHSGGLYLDGIKKISDKAIDSLSKYQGMLTLNGLTALSDAAVGSLSKHEGELWLDGVIGLSDAAAESLSKHKGMINDMDPREWVESLKK